MFAALLVFATVAVAGCGGAPAQRVPDANSILAATEEASRSNDTRPNIIFLIVESTDGRAWTPGYQNDVLRIPNIRSLQQHGHTFTRHYSNAPVCCPSRATFWSGRHASNIRHKHGNLTVGGVWNNYEGLPAGYSDRIDQVLGRNGYDVRVTGKTDWSTAGHTETATQADLALWSMYVEFPYNTTIDGGWRSESSDECRGNGTVLPGNKTAHQKDWTIAHENHQWLLERDNQSNPFFLFQGFDIVHPPYVTSEHYYHQVNPEKIDVPEWPALSEMHPCDFQSAMLKGCIPAGGPDSAEGTEVYSIARRRNIRRIYLSMIEEFDAMVGLYISAVKQTSLWNDTVWILSSDHGDMQMEHQQFYKMTPYDASASVPMVVYYPPLAPLASQAFHLHREHTQLIDIMPTILEFARVPASQWPSVLDGYSLMPLLTGSTETARPSFVVSQFHGKNLAMSWYVVASRLSNGTAIKLIQWGTGAEVSSLLFNMDVDPGETNNLIASASGKAQNAPLVASLKASLRTVVDDVKVTQEVAEFNRQVFLAWVHNNTAAGKDWRTEVARSSCWRQDWRNASAALAALEDWIANPAAVRPCRPPVA
eukprot:m.248506 g.248506  ORF g.248506 m.248506 type:complete len:593 (-) comp19078_c1_seq3:209-1987(-)